CGFPEVVYCPGKTAGAIIDVFRTLLAHGQNCLATRVAPEQARDVLEAFPQARYNPMARTLRIDATADGAARRCRGKVAVITAGTADLPVAEEAAETAKWMGCDVDLIIDVGVAGPQRLPAQKHRFECADAIVVAAGMEGALPSVVGGHVSCPVIAVPTSIGYGASFGGRAGDAQQLRGERDGREYRRRLQSRLPRRPHRAEDRRGTQFQVTAHGEILTVTPRDDSRAPNRAPKTIAPSHPGRGPG